MRRLLLVGLLLLTACEITEPDDDDDSDTDPSKGRIQGQLTPFRGSSAEVGEAARPLPLQGDNARKLAAAFSRVLAQKRQEGRVSAMDVTIPGLPIIPPPAGPPPLNRLPVEDPTVVGDVLVRFEEAGLSPQVALERVKLAGYRAVHKGYSSEYLHLVGFEALDGHALTVAETGQLVAKVAEVPGVRFAEKNLRMYPFRVPGDKGYTHQWHYPTLNLPAAWDVTTGNSSVVVAVLDTGIKSHPDLQPRVIAGYDMISDATNAGDGNGRDADPTDRGGDEPGGKSSWHGTHVAGTIGAVTDDGAGVSGVTWATRILPVRVLGKQGGTNADIIAAMNWAAGGTVPGVPNNPTPAKIINLSLGGPSAPQKSYQDVIDARVAAGAIFVIAAGNENVDATNTTPCNQENVICVGSTNFAGKRSSFSNFGPKVDVMASGGEMVEDLNGDDYADGVLSTSFDDDGTPAYIFNQGTSMATPHVAGVVALMAAVKPTVSSAEAENILKATASASSQCSEGCGMGLVNAQAALKRLQGGGTNDPPKLGITTTLLSFRGSGTQRVLISNLGGGTLSVTAAKSGPQAASVTFPKGTTVSVPAFGTQALEVAVNAGGLANGEYSASLTLTGASGAGTATVAVKIRVGALQDQNAIIGFAWQDTAGEWQVDEEAVKEVPASGNYQYSISLVPHEYYALATIDDDGDGEIFEDGERTGFWRNVDSFEPIPLEAGKTVSNISFDLVPLTPIDDTPSLVVGGPCASNADCPDGGRCVTTYPGGYCTRDCNTQACPTGSKCYEVDSTSGARACIATCTGPGAGRSTCRTDYVCYDDEAGGGQCLPDCRTYNICGSSGTCSSSSGYCL